MKYIKHYSGIRKLIRQPPIKIENGGSLKYTGILKNRDRK